MATFSLNRKPSYHARSISLPSRPHPLTTKVDEELYRLKTCATSSSSSLSSVVSSLTHLKDLHDSVDDLLQLPLTRQVLAQEKSHKSMEEVLGGSLQMLDVCSATRDVVSRIKECTQDLQSSLRRRRGGELGVENEVGVYMKSRKEVCKVIQKCLVDLKRVENKRVFSSLLEKDNNHAAIVGVLREVEAMTISTFESLLPLVSLSRSRSKQTGWSLVSKLMNNKHVGVDADISEMEKVDVALSSLMSNKSCKGIDWIHVHNAQKQLETLELSIQGFEEGLECVYRSLIKRRVTLLNILSQ